MIQYWIPDLIRKIKVFEVFSVLWCSLDGKLKVRKTEKALMFYKHYTTC